MPLCERPKKPDHCPPEIYNILMLHCWAHEPHQRARFSVLKKLMDEVGVEIYTTHNNLHIQEGFLGVYIAVEMGIN